MSRDSMEITPVPIMEEKEQPREGTLIDQEEGAESEAAQVLSNTKLVFFGLSQLVLWATHSSGILQVSFVLPFIQRDLGVDDAEVQWVVASYMLTWGCFQLIAGKLCDVFGRRRGFVTGSCTWILFTMLSAFMPNLAGLNVCRALTGLSSAILLPASSGIVGTLYPRGQKRTLAYVAITCGGAAGASGSELFAGIFLRWVKFTWRACFFISAIIMFFPLVASLFIIPPDPPTSHDCKVDWLGAGSIASGLFCFLLTLTISQTSSKGWKTPYLPALLVVSAILCGFFVWRQIQLVHAAEVPGNTKPPPLIPRGLVSWRKRNVLMIYLASFFTWATTDSFFVFVSYLYFDILHMDAFEAGLKLSVTLFSGSVAAVVVALTISHVPPRILIALGCAISCAAPILFAVRGLSWAYWKSDLWAFLVVAYGTDATIAAGSTVISQSARPQDQSVAASLFQTSCRLGYAVGLAIATLIKNAVAKADGASEDGGLKGLRAAFWTLAGYTLLATVLVAFGMTGWHKLDRTHAQEESDELDGLPVVDKHRVQTQ